MKITKKMPRRKKDSIEGGKGRNGREKPQQRNAANARERARMRILSRAFSRLKTTLPWVPADTKLSKLDTLRLATSYIAHLRTLLCDDHSTKTNSLTPHPMALTWPFSFNKSQSVREPPCEVSLPCDPSYNHYNQHMVPYNHAGGINNLNNNNTINHLQNHNHIDRYYGDEPPDYEYYTTDVFQMA